MPWRGARGPVLFISGIDGFCHRYEVLHRAEQLALDDRQTLVRYFADSRISRDVRAAEVIILYRVPCRGVLVDALCQARRAGHLVLGLVDDLIFLDEPTAVPPFVTDADRGTWFDGVRRYHATLDLCDAVICATEPLRTEAERCGWRTFLHRDALSELDLDLAGAVLRSETGPQKRGADAPVLFGYFSGTATHDADFREVAPALLEAMRADPRISLLLVGPLSVPAELAAMGDRVRRRPTVAWTALPALVAQVDVNLAPLAWRDRFTACKGELKYLEAAVVEVPTIASPTAAFRAAIDDGDNGRLADGRVEWGAAIAELAGDRGLRESMGRNACRDVHRRYGPAQGARDLVRMLDAATAGHRPVRAPIPQDEPDRPGEKPAWFALAPNAPPVLVDKAPLGESPPLGPTDELQQVFLCRLAGLFRVDVFTVTYAQDLDHELHLALSDDRGLIVLQQAVPAGRLPDRAWFALEFAPVPSSAGRSFSLRIRATGSGSGNAASLGLAALCPQTGPASWNEHRLGHAILIRAFANGGRAPHHAE